jgi:hypothetical protein
MSKAAKKTTRGKQVVILTSKQVSQERARLIEIVRVAHNEFTSAFSRAFEQAVKAGQALNTMKNQKLVPHGQWPTVYKQCKLGDRQAERYMQLAKRWERANPTLKSDLASGGLSIEAAIRKLAPKPDSQPNEGARPEQTSRRSTSTKKSKPQATLAEKAPPPTSHKDIIEAWMYAPPAERAHALDAIGPKSWLDAIPESWKSQLRELLTQQKEILLIEGSATEARSTGDLSIPDPLRRDKSKVAQ